MFAKEQKSATAEESFRESLKDLLVIAQKIGPHCDSVEALIGVCQLAIDNDHQLALLISLVTSPGKK